MIEEKFFTTEQVANILQVHPFTILKFIREGKLKGIKLGRVYRIQESDIKDFLEERMTKSKTKEKPKKSKKKEKEAKVEVSTEIPEDKHFSISKDDSDNPSHYYVI